MAVNPDGSINVDVAALPLPTGAATEAKQDTGNTSLSSIDTKLSQVIDGILGNPLTKEGGMVSDIKTLKVFKKLGFPVENTFEDPETGEIIKL